MSDTVIPKNYILVHHSPDGVELHLFSYEFEPSAPYPDPLGLVEAMGLNVDYSADTLELIPLTIDRFTERFRSQDVRGREEMCELLSPKDFATFNN